MLNSTEDIAQDGDKITFSSEKDKAYYQGNLDNVEIPWNISLRYSLDGTEYSAEEIAGKSGKLEIRFNVTENTVCSGNFFDDYALQASFTLDTEQCSNISAPDATIANVGSDKQLTYTILPGEGINTAITADVKDFEMNAVSINGVHLNLNVEVDDAELKDKVNELITAVEQLDNGAEELSDGSAKLENGTSQTKDGASSLHSGIVSLDEGVVTLQNGLGAVQDGLDTLNSQSGSLTTGSSEFKAALTTIQAAVNSISVTNEDLTMLSEASSQIRQAISDLYDGASTLQTNLGYEQYKSAMAQNGVDIDQLLAGNAGAIETIQSYESLLEQLSSVPGMEDLVNQYKSQLLETSEQVKILLNANSAAIAGTEAYLNEISSRLPALTQGLSELDTQYETFDTSISQLVNTLGNMTGNLSALADGTGEFRTETAGMNDQIDEEIDSLLESIGGSMDDPVSFVSEKNTNVESVQFVIQSEAIEVEEADNAEDTAEEELSIWQRFLNLFQ